jgi:hypothetical protein
MKNVILYKCPAKLFSASRIQDDKQLRLGFRANHSFPVCVLAIIYRMANHAGEVLAPFSISLNDL